MRGWRGRCSEGGGGGGLDRQPPLRGAMMGLPIQHSYSRVLDAVEATAMPTQDLHIVS